MIHPLKSDDVFQNPSQNIPTRCGSSWLIPHDKKKNFSFSFSVHTSHTPIKWIIEVVIIQSIRHTQQNVVAVVVLCGWRLTPFRFFSWALKKEIDKILSNWEIREISEEKKWHFVYLGLLWDWTHYFVRKCQ